MCGIVGGINSHNVVPDIIEGLKRLEYRGYDSVGIAGIIHEDEKTSLQRIRVTDRVQKLYEQVKDESFKSNASIGHTRWATHGKPSVKNAHPHFSNDVVGVVHNGIIENHSSLRDSLIGRGYVFSSDTDTEVIAHLVHYYLQLTQTLIEAVTLTVEKLRGQYAIGVISLKHPDELIVTRQGAPIVIGLADGGNYFASDVSALLPITSKFMYLEDGDFAKVTTDNVEIFDSENQSIERVIVTSGMSAVSTELGIFQHFMQKEIFEQPKAILETLSSVNEHGLNPMLFGPLAENLFAHIEHVTIIACGTSFNAGTVAKNWIEDIANIPVVVEIASEYISRKVADIKNNLVIAISQSGETADTILAVQGASKKGYPVLSICNVPESSLTRISTMKFMTKAGPEIGVASTKAFTTQLVALRIFAYCVAKAKHIPFDEKLVLKSLRQLPHCIRLALATEPQIILWAEELTKFQNAIYLGKGAFCAIAEEGSLKLKEVSYIHAESYASGELKHGPLALIDEKMPVIMIISDDEYAWKNISSLQEVAARDGNLFVLTQKHLNLPVIENLKRINISTLDSSVDPIVAVIPLQLLAYHTALLRGLDVDKPRNIAKAVTV